MTDHHAQTTGPVQQVRWFAGAAHAAGLEQESLAAAEVPQGATVRGFLAERHPRTVTVLGRCSFLADGRSFDGDSEWPRQAAVVDVLPPFTGG